jgi:transposase
VSDEEWGFVAPYLTLMREDAPQRAHDLREVFNGLRWMVRGGSPWRLLPHDFPPWAAVYQQTQSLFADGTCRPVLTGMLLEAEEGVAFWERDAMSAAVVNSR